MKTISIIAMIINIFPTFFLLVCFFLYIFGSDDIEPDIAAVTISGVMLVVDFFVYKACFNKIKYSNYATMLDAMFTTSSDNEVNISSAATCLDIEINKFRKIFRKLVSGRYIINCALSESKTGVIILKDKQPKANKAIIKCENCGGINDLRYNASGVCEYCGSKLE